MRIAALQSNLIWENPDLNYLQFENKLLNLTPSADLIVLPELFSSGFSMNTAAFSEPINGKGFQWMQKLSQQTQSAIMGSIAVNEQNSTKNRLYTVFPDGRFCYYDKRHLFRMGQEDLHYTPGLAHRVFTHKGFSVMGLICYDLRFPVWSRNQKLHSGYTYDLLVYVANWPERRSLAWKSLLLARAIENQAYVVGLNRIGNDGNGISHAGESLIIDPNGQILAQGERHAESILTCTLDIARLQEIRSSFPVLRDADPFEFK